jgi:soluble lytic murein transglycosylase-like protein
MALALLVGCVPAAHAQIYFWRDANGTAVMSDRAPAPGTEVMTFAVPGTRAIRVTRPSDGRHRQDYDAVIESAAKAARIRPDLVKAVIQVESGFDSHARSSKGAMGLMQLMPETARDLGVREPFHEEDNVLGGTRYLRVLRDRYSGSWTHALAAYNAGPSTVDRYRGVPPFAETQEYVTRVLSYYRRYHGDFPR